MGHDRRRSPISKGGETLTLIRTWAPILRSLSRMVPHVATANWVCLSWVRSLGQVLGLCDHRCLIA